MSSTNRQRTEKVREKELHQMVVDVLEENGALSKLRADLRFKVLDIVRGGDKSPMIKPPESQRSNLAVNSINKMILEYFQWNSYNYTKDMFALETGSQFDAMDRTLLEKQLGLDDSGGASSQSIREFPLLLHVAMNMLADKNQI